MRIRLLILLLPALLAGCVLGPNYRRPAVSLPGQFRGSPPDASDASIADRKWSDLFHDETLTAALLDRLTHRAHILEFTGAESFRLKQRLKKQEGKPE